MNNKFSNEFIKATTFNSGAFEKVFDLIQNPFKESGRRLLGLVDTIIEYYIKRADISTPRFPIVYFPSCENWAQELCEEYVALKFSFLFGTMRQKDFQCYLDNNKTMKLPAGLSGNKGKRYIYLLKNRKNFAATLVNYEPYYDSEENSKNLLFCKRIEYEHRKYNPTRYFSDLHELVGGADTIFDHNHSLSLVEEGSARKDTVYDLLSDSEKNMKFPNIFIFLKTTIEGNNKFRYLSLDASSVEDYNEAGRGIENVFYFVFSTKAYHLQNILNRKDELVARYQKNKGKKKDAPHDFISFTESEMNYIFRRDYRHGQKKRSFKPAIDLETLSILDDLQSIFYWTHHDFKFRNEMAISLTERSQEKFISDLKMEILGQDMDLNADFTIRTILQEMTQSFHETVESRLRDFVAGERVSVIVDRNIDQLYLDEYRRLLTDLGALSVRFDNFRSLRGHDTLISNITRVDRILVVSMLGHNTGFRPIYPNSFDEIRLSEGQRLLSVLNLWALDPRYSYCEYYYAQKQKELLDSDFRIKYLKNAIVLPPKVNILHVDYTDDDEEYRNSERSNAAYNKYKIIFGNHQHRTLQDNDTVLCCVNNENSFFTMEQLWSLFNEDIPQSMAIQPISDFTEALKDMIADMGNKVGNEHIYKESYKEQLTEDEISSQGLLWKILLRHEAERRGAMTVFEEIMNPMKENERISSFDYFEKYWLDESSSLTLPRNRRLQRRVIIDYLGLQPNYLRLLRFRNSQQKNDTEEQNLLLKHFVSNCLLSSNLRMPFLNLGDNIKDLLNIDSLYDLEEVVDQLKEIVNLQRVTKISKI